MILPNAILPKKRKASKELVSGKIAFPAKRRSPAPTSYQVKKATQAKVEPLPMKQFKFDGKSSGQADKGALPEGSTKARHRVKQEPFASPHLMAPTTSGCHGLFDGTNDDDGVSGPIKDQPLDSINLTHHRQRSDISNEGIGGTESEIERGATNLWSILQKADAANTDEEDRGDAETKLSVKCSLMSPKSAQTSISPQKKARRDFLSTVLNDSPGKTAKASTVDPLPEPTNKGPSLIDSSGNPDQLADSPHTPANYDSQNRQAHLKADTDAIGVETAATLPKPRKPISTHTNPKLSSKPKSTNTTTNDPRTPSRICKTTGKPFDRTITVRATPRKRAPPIAEYVSDQIAIPTSWAQVSDADQRMMQMKEEGRGWEAIRRMWRETTGQDAAPSTLPNRYNRIKANLTVLQDGEVSFSFAFLPPTPLTCLVPPPFFRTLPCTHPPSFFLSLPGSLCRWGGKQTKQTRAFLSPLNN